MSTTKYKVTCEDGTVRHHALFPSKTEARTWADRGHACTSVDRHTISPTTDEGDFCDRVRIEYTTHAGGPGHDPAFIRVIGPNGRDVILSCMAVGEGEDAYLDIDVHPFVDNDHATAGVFGMSNGFRTAFDTTKDFPRTTSQGWPSANLVAVLVGWQETISTTHEENPS